MASSLITWQTDGEKVETVTDFIFLGCKITADGDCSHKIKRYLLFGRKGMTNLDSELKQSHHFANKSPQSQSYGFSSRNVRMWELDHDEGWALENWYFWTVVLEKTLESLLDSKEIKPVNPKKNQPWNSLEGLMLKLKIQYYGHLMWANSMEKTLMLRKTEVRRREQQRMRWLDGITDSMDMSLSKRKLVMNSPWGCKESNTTEGLNNWWSKNGFLLGSHDSQEPCAICIPRIILLLETDA